MKTKIFALLSSLLVVFSLSSQETKMKYKKLTPEESRVILEKGTERPFTGVYNKHKADGKYLCKQCNQPLFHSDTKFDSGSGWPSFDDAIEGAVKEVPDKDGHRTEIVCSNCEGHLGHVFRGEGMTDKNTRHCVNSVSLDFEPESNKLQEAVFGAGCFWGVEYLFQELDGVVKTEVGYMGGRTSNPSYKEVCYENTGHVEVAKVFFDPEKISFKEIAKFFFEIHDPTQHNRQGPDIGEQYRSVIFYANQAQQDVAEDLRMQLTSKGLNIATAIEPAKEFWKAEGYHQDYYKKNGKKPYCHRYEKRF